MLNESVPSLSDIKAVTNNDSFGGNNWLTAILIFAIIFGGFGGGGLFSGSKQYATNDEMQRGFDNQNTMSRFDDISSAIASSSYENAQLINNSTVQNMQNLYGVSTAMNNGFNGVQASMNSGFDNLQTSINNLAHQMESCCCSLKTQMLQDKYDSAQNQLNMAEIASANAVQTQNILGQLGKYYSNPPYAGYYGTTIS